MPQQRSRKNGRIRKTSSKVTINFDEKSAQNDSENERMDMSDKDEEEDELERLVMGDDAGFRAHLSMGNMEVDEEEEPEKEGAEEVDVEAESDLENVNDADLFFYDSGPAGPNVQALVPFNGPEEQENEDAPAWEDSDDDRLNISLAGNSRLRKLRVNAAEDVVSGKEYTRRLRRQFEVLHPVPEWAQQSSRPSKRRRRSSESSDSSISADEDDISTLPLARFLQDASSLSRAAPEPGKKIKLRPEKLNIQKTHPIPGPQPSAVTSLSFHPEYPVLLSSGLASTLYMHHIAPAALPTPNPRITSVHIRGTPIHTSAFHPNGEKIFFSGRRSYFHTWDMPSGTIQKVNRVYGHKEEQKSMERFKISPCGRYMGLVGSSKKGGGVINILNASTTQWIAAARIEGKNGVADFAWWGDGEGFTVVGKGGDVGEYNVEARSFVTRWIDDGSIGATVVALGGSGGPKPLGSDRWVVIGSQSGIINIYDRRTFVTGNEITVKERPEPKKRFEQLVTPTSNLAFSPDGQLLAFSSKWKKDALRLVHLPSCEVYRNWPTSSTPLGTITAVAFSRGSDMLAVGNEAGKIRLWEIRSY